VCNLLPPDALAGEIFAIACGSISASLKA